MLLREKSGGDLSVRFWHGVAVNHASDVTSVSGDLLAADLMGRASNPVLGILARIAEHILVNLGLCGQISLTHHGLLQCEAAHVDFIAS